MENKLWHKNVFGPLAFFSLLVVSILGPVRFAIAEKVDLPPAELSKIATHVIVGDILSIHPRTEERDGYLFTQYVAQVKIRRVEKGLGLHKGEVCDIRYWHRKRKGNVKAANGRFIVSTGTSGHRGLPVAGDAMRVYLARNAYDGFFQNNDGGFNVVGANGFQKLSRSTL